MELYSKLEPIDEEEVEVIGETSAPLHNQEVINNINEDENGNLTYKGQPISSKRPTETKEFLYDDYIVVPIPCFANKGFKFIDYGESPSIPLGTEIAKIEFVATEEDYFNNIWMDFSRMVESEEKPYIVFLTTAHIDDEQEICYGKTYRLSESQNSWEKTITSGVFYATRITYYVD